MTSTGDGGGREPLDPDFAGLFRPDDDAPAPVWEPIDPEPVDSEPVAAPEPAAADLPDAEPSAAPPVAEPSVDTGRLFRSQGVTGRDDAVLALSSDHGGRLRTLGRRSDDAPVAPIEQPAGLPDAGAPSEPAVSGQDPVMVAAAHDEPGPARGRGRRRGPAGGIRAGAVYLIVIVVTVLAGFANALVFGDIGWPTGLALLASSVYAALMVRRADDIVAVITPPVAMGLVALTAGQLTLGAVEGTVLNRAVVVFFTLAENWVWTIGATVAALVIILVRRRRS